MRLDGGAMFGNAPKALWERWITPDKLNRIRLASRSLLVSTGTHKVLFETGVGTYMEPKLRERYGVEETGHLLLKSLKEIGMSHEDITEIILSHLHFDHAGGLLSAWQEGKEPDLLFPNAKYYVSEEAWKHARHPHYRDKASFLPILNQKLEESNRLVQVRNGDILTFDELKVRFLKSNGHTKGMLSSDLRWDKNRLVFAADLVPGRFWVHVPITMGYDRFPELLINEKETLLTSLTRENGWLFYTHDPEIAVSKVGFDAARNTFVAIDSYKDLKEVIL
jgi:glyoxylase-like metal-dependent hydrolase (beta-lactamase superfamily II)